MSEEKIDQKETETVESLHDRKKIKYERKAERIMNSSESIDLSSLTTHGERFRYARLRKGLTQRELAVMSGKVKQGMLSNYEKSARGHLRMPLATLIDLASLLDVSLDWLLTGKEKSVSPDGKIFALGNNYAPLLRWQDVHLWKTIGKETMNLSKNESILLQDIKSTNCFALRIEDTEYTQYKTLPFTLGDTIIIDADKTPKTGNYVVISHNNGADITLRRMGDNGNLVHPNAVEMEKVTDKTIFYGVVVSQFRKLAD